jgi:hypothetical protein
MMKESHENKARSLGNDLFVSPELLPSTLKECISRWMYRVNEELMCSYKACEILNDELKKYGYACSCGLDGTPIDLKKI